MLREFYDFIAKRINGYFQAISSQGILQLGESFCLKLDDEDMVEGVTESLRKLSEQNRTLGEYSYKCMDGTVYRTYTLKVVDDEIIIASQINGMTNDFLCATLRNAANDAKKPILMISSNPIDSAKSGSRNMTANGMPFYPGNLMQEIRKMAEESTQLTFLEQRILDFELSRRESDVFSDKTSLYEYKDLLSIMSGGLVARNNFPGFRLFYVDGKKDFSNFGKMQIDKELKKNNQFFERIDRSIRFGNLESDLSNDFEDSFIIRIERTRKDDPENWSTLFTYAEVLTAMEKKQAKKENPLQIDLEDITIYGEIPLESLALDEKVLIRNEGSMTTKKRRRSMIIFNPDKYPMIHIRVACNVKVHYNDISADDISFVKEANNLVFELNRSGISFHKIEITDTANDITYIFKICILDLYATYLAETIKRNFIINWKKTKSKSSIKLLGIGTDLIFNQNGAKNMSEKLDDNEEYRCNYDERLHLYASEDELANYGCGINIQINFAGIVVPFSLFPDEAKSVEITGRKILRDKIATKGNFEFIDNLHIYKESQEYFAKANLLRELRIEQQIVDDGITCGKCRHFYASEQVKIEKVNLEIESNLLDSYLNLLAAYKSASTVPTLAYMGGEIKKAAQKYLEAFKQVFVTLEEGKPFSKLQEEALFLGSISVGNEDNEILLTPLHPLNIEYQLMLAKEKSIDSASDIVVDRLNSINLLPYIRRNKKIYKVSDQLYSTEWKYYAPAENRKYRGSRRYVPKLVEEKIVEFSSHFKYIFEDINNKTIKINLINMGDCSDVFIGIAQYFIHSVNRQPDVDQLMRFEIHVYTDDKKGNVFSNLRDYGLLKKYLADMKLSVVSGITMNNLEGIMSKNVACYFYKDTGKNYAYAHISFYEMESEVTSEIATMNQIETGAAIGGILSGVPSSKYGQKYRTGFGTKYAKRTKLIELAEQYNALVQVGTTGNPYYSGSSISTQIDSKAEDKMNGIYDASNWVVFVNPKVDLDFFSEKEANSDLLIIHYSDQYTSSSGYDAITVTQKSKQYSKVIQEYLKDKGIDAELRDISNIINLFNAINGDWLLRLVSSKKMVGANKDSTFSREKISIVAAIKFMLAFLRHPDILWVPISLEEMLRVSGGAGLSRDEGILSAKNLGFEKGPTSDDLLFIGLNYNADKLKIYLYPTEVKTGINDNVVIKKAFEQSASTANGLKQAFAPNDELVGTILYKVNRNFLMQLLVTSCKKMKVYHVDDSQKWDIVIDQFREAILNEEYEISDDIREVLGKGAVLSFRKAHIERRTSFKEDAINFIEMLEYDEFELILKTVDEISDNIALRQDNEFMLFNEKDISGLTGDFSKLNVTKFEQDKTAQDKEICECSGQKEERNPDDEPFDEPQNTLSEMNELEVSSPGIQVKFGVNQQNGMDVIWEPNNTDILFHTNTGIIGTMGTGKTQFTQSLIAQIYQKRTANIASDDVGILIFDYKGDYNETKTDFVKLTDAKVYRPYHLPFNSLALAWSETPKPLLPVHTANTFVDTLAKVNSSLGPKQKNILLNCIDEAYSRCGIKKADSSTWANEPPTFANVYQIYDLDEDIKKGDVLDAILSKISMFEIFEPVASNTKSLFDLLHGVVVIDMSGYDADIQNLVVALTLDLFYSQMQAAGHSKLEGSYRQMNKLILVDEADNFLRECYPSLRKILKEGREFGVGTILSTQFLKHFVTKEEDYSKYILSWVIHNVADLANADVRFVFNTQPGSSDESRICSDIKNLKKHESIVKIGNVQDPIYMKDNAFWKYAKEILEER
ncbi:helicase HerA domain-containing protein [Clostridium sp. Marseille-P2415]|uniref:helicase HerA domain-containing protein n=1 Tax=Clostridium sp. Marseille-P2415 TaxID=1805471 RepID=UPI0013563AC8|nr:DUF87 domain-containing protein [Clostridium sp. Marseille-P2415]